MCSESFGWRAMAAGQACLGSPRTHARPDISHNGLCVSGLSLSHVLSNSIYSDMKSPTPVLFPRKPPSLGTSIPALSSTCPSLQASPLQHIQADLRDSESLLPDHCNQAGITIKSVTQTFCLPSAYKVMLTLYWRLLCLKKPMHVRTFKNTLLHGVPCVAQQKQSD